MKPKLLVAELWGMGDLVLATPFLKAAVLEFDVTLIARPAALELQPFLWPGVNVIPFVFPWTAFKRKYVLTDWPWRKLIAVVGVLRREKFDIAVSARWDPRDHFLLRLAGARRRIGFSRLASRMFLTQSLVLPPAGTHRYENWLALGRSLDLELPPKNAAVVSAQKPRSILIHSGAGQPARIWPLDRFQSLASRLRQQNYLVQIACDPGQQQWWLSQGEKVAIPASISELAQLIGAAGLFIGNDSGPGHLAAILGVPTVTLFGNQFPASFHPLHPQAQWLEGAPCPFKPCYDSCRFARPECLLAISLEEVWLRVSSFVASHFNTNVAK